MAPFVKEDCSLRTLVAFAARKLSRTTHGTSLGRRLSPPAWTPTRPTTTVERASSARDSRVTNPFQHFLSFFGRKRRREKFYLACLYLPSRHQTSLLMNIFPPFLPSSLPRDRLTSQTLSKTLFIKLLLRKMNELTFFRQLRDNRNSAESLHHLDNVINARWL